ncbi:hypothetical protein [Pseudomonas fluorescens]|uniref:hypothetical protein n=1 Tax=Pseudomonas fluorescens TaxID=294 RepID=UPI00123F8FAC|nr:hypothetical protein [Pseudomonas fluorescens]
MLKLAKKAILDSGDFLPQDQIAQRFGLPPTTLKAALDEWETEGHIFSVQDSGCSLFPTYVFQDGTEHGPMPELKAILDVLRTKKDGWGIAFWFASSNGYIGGCRLRIPRHPATQPTNIRPPVPRSSGRAVGAQRRRFALLV